MILLLSFFVFALENEFVTGRQKKSFKTIIWLIVFPLAIIREFTLILAKIIQFQLGFIHKAPWNIYTLSLAKTIKKKKKKTSEISEYFNNVFENCWWAAWFFFSSCIEEQMNLTHFRVAVVSQKQIKDAHCNFAY